MYNGNRLNSEWAFDGPASNEFEFSSEWEFAEEISLESPFSEGEEMELAAELLEIMDEEELEQFLGKLFKKAWRGIRKVGRSVFRPLGRVLKSVAKKALPFLGGALGSFIPVPGVGTAIGSAVGGALSKALEMEFEGLDPEDQEFEMARRFVRLAGTAARQAAMTPPGIDPQMAVNQALTAAARQQMPQLASGQKSLIGSMNGRGRSGRCVRRGRTIIIFGA
ncbi:MAG: hypothetical protein H6633_34135 [Anaerolineales bacterium]|nr:hypothetical protein [Anaerolineales bacterium]